MGAVYFYHLTESPMDVALPMLLGKARGAGWRILVRVPDAALRERLDVGLWRGAGVEFMAHGVAGGGHDDAQPILLADAAHATSGFACVMSVAGADITAAEVTDAARVCILFDGHDEGALNHARRQWKALTDAGCSAQYWAQDAGSWVKKAEK